MDDVRIRVRTDDDSARGMHSATQNAEQAGQRIRSALADTAGGAAGSLGDRLGPLGGLLGKLGPAGAAAGAAVGAGLAAATVAAGLLKKALDASIERANVGALIGAQGAGTDTKRIAELGKLAGAVYADNFGESIQQAGQAVRDAIRSHLIPEDSGDEAVKVISEKLLTLGQIAEADTSEVSRAVHKMLVTGMAKDANEAFDILTRGFQNGANEAGDLLDTFDEYSIQFKELGLNGKEALGLIGQGLRSGARDADTVADALKEIAIRAQDGSKGSETAFKALGLDAKQLGTMFASGGDQARKAIDMVIDKTKGITDPMQRNAVAVGLFGTKAEDLQDALFGLDLDTAVKGLGDVEGAADRASAALGSGLGPTIETFKRKAQQAFADVGDKVAPLVMQAVTELEKFGASLSDIFDGSEVPQELIDALKEMAQNWIPALREALGDMSDKVHENKEGLELLGHVLAEYVIPFLGGTAVIALKALAFAFGRVIETINILVVGSREASAVIKTAMINMALTVINMLDGIISTAARAFSWVPGLGPKLEAAAKEVHKFVEKVNSELKNIRDEDVNITYHYRTKGQSRTDEMATGGIKGAATGGARNGLTMVGEEGRELVRLPQGAMVYPNANTNQMMAMSGNGQGGTTTLLIGSDGSALGDLLVDALAVTLRARGGDPSLIGLKVAR